jgi:hypothetical protein
MRDFMQDTMKTVIQQQDYKGVGMHGLENHGGHGFHSQTSIGVNNSTINFREFPNDATIKR